LEIRICSTNWEEITHRQEHCLPLRMAFGGGGAGKFGKKIHERFMHGLLSMAAYAWGWEDV